MILNSIKLSNYRNYSTLNLEFSKNINIIIGNNAIGKTNILESIYVLSLTKSFRTINDTNLIKHGENQFTIEGSTYKGGFDNNLKIVFNKSKNLFVNKKKVNKINDYLSNLNVIIFSPDDLNIIKGSPDIRRKYLNTEISQIYSPYCKILSDYNLLLKMRNDYLKKIKANTKIDKTYLEVLENYLIDRAINIYKIRNKFINKISEYSNSIYKDTMQNDNFKIKYKTIPFINEFNENCIKKNMKKAFKDNYNNEIKYGSTLYGPHKDDFEFELGDEDLKIIGSQSQQKIAVLVFKLAEIKLFKKQTNEFPILLLDDIFSELDDTRKNNVLSYINKDIQTIITTTDINNINEEIKNNSKIFIFNDKGIIENKR